MPDNLDSKYDLADNTYTAKEQSFAVCEVGDAKQPAAFYPQVKIMRWDNEVNFSARLVSDEVAPVISLVDNKIQWVGDKVEAYFYEIGEGKEGGGFEFEIILKEPPKSNVISMTLQTKGLDFFYQPSLTLEEIEKGCERPENVVGSYAVYHKTMAGNYSLMGGRNYKAGKAFHIYRPRIEDAKGNWVWGELNIDEKAGLLTVIIPQDFLDKAAYPVRHAAGLEFGYHSEGGSNACIIGGQIRYAKSYTTPESDGILSSIACYGVNWFGSPNWTPALYTDSGGKPNTRLTYINTGGTAIGALDWYTSTVPEYGVESGIQYWFGIRNGNSGGDAFYIYYDDSAGNIYIADNTGGDYPAIADVEYYAEPRIISIYATYTPAAGGQATAKRFGGVPHVAVNRGIW